MAREAIRKYLSRTKSALRIKNGDDIWIVVGKTSEWTDEESPDAPLPESNSIIEPVVAIKVEVMSLVTIITEEAYLLLGEEERAVVYIDSVIIYLQLIDDNDAYIEAARYLYLGVNYDPFIAGHPSCVSFRVYYAVSGLVPSLGHETDDWLLPEDVEDYGVVEYENSGEAIIGGVSVFLPAIIEFR